LKNVVYKFYLSNFKFVYFHSSVELPAVVFTCVISIASTVPSLRETNEATGAGCSFIVGADDTDFAGFGAWKSSCYNNGKKS